MPFRGRHGNRENGLGIRPFVCRSGKGLVLLGMRGAATARRVITIGNAGSTRILAATRGDSTRRPYQMNLSKLILSILTRILENPFITLWPLALRLTTSLMPRLLRKAGFELDFIGHGHLRCQLHRCCLRPIRELVSLDIFLRKVHQSYAQTRMQSSNSQPNLSQLLPPPAL